MGPSLARNGPIGMIRLLPLDGAIGERIPPLQFAESKTNVGAPPLVFRGGEFAFVRLLKVDLSPSAGAGFCVRGLREPNLHVPKPVFAPDRQVGDEQELFSAFFDVGP